MQLRIDDEGPDPMLEEGDAPPLPDLAEPLEDVAELHVTTRALADLLGVSVQAIRKMTAGGMPKRDRNCYRLADVLGWWVERRDRHATEQAESAREELYRAQTRRATLIADREEGRMVSTAHHEAVVVETFQALADALEAAPTKATRDPAERAHLAELMESARVYLAERITALAARRERRAASAGPATASEPRRVGRPASGTAKG